MIYIQKIVLVAGLGVVLVLWTPWAVQWKLIIVLKPSIVQSKRKNLTTVANTTSVASFL